MPDLARDDLFLKKKNANTVCNNHFSALDIAIKSMIQQHFIKFNIECKQIIAHL